ncbi:hypothetical protein BJ322DRAFT_387887 [Thelephora terrestris]|uniref:Uncharacterized protein n=1 Tax=Thelephora terrestris TaxID=56493 RepID=A0A9P6HME9_9AGAM|nr:hypothetical protein BJ322DRAFT_387887 [Thelephora terrestris]
MMSISLVFDPYCRLFAFDRFLFYRIRLPSLVSCSRSWVGLDPYIASKGICFIAPFIFVVWLSSPSHVIAFLGVLFDTTPIPRSCLLSLVGLSFWSCFLSLTLLFRY